MAPEDRKKQITFRAAPDVVAALEATGPGWRTRIEDIVRKALID